MFFGRTKPKVLCFLHLLSADVMAFASSGESIRVHCVDRVSPKALSSLPPRTYDSGF
jgi:hypothetical protein